MKNAILLVIKSKALNKWIRKIRIDDKAVFHYFKSRLANFVCEIETKVNLADAYDCLIEKNNDTYNLIDSLGELYSELSLSSCYALVCMKYINIKKERHNIHAWAVHAGSFLYNNDLFLIVGSTHSGKSTTLFDLINKHCAIKYLNDDITLFDTESLKIIPFCKPLQLRVVIQNSKIGDYYVDYFAGKEVKLSTISPPFLDFKRRIKYNRIKMFLLIRDNSKQTNVTPINNLQKYLSLMLNCYNDSIAENRKYISKLNNDIIGYQIIFRDGDDVAQMIFSTLCFDLVQ